MEPGSILLLTEAEIHITAVGSDGPEKQELDPEVLARVHRIVCDSREQCLHLGELQHGAFEKARAEGVEELGRITAGLAPGRRNDAEMTLADLTGVGVQDTAIALHAYAGARASGLGRTL